MSKYKYVTVLYFLIITFNGQAQFVVETPVANLLLSKLSSGQQLAAGESRIQRGKMLTQLIETIRIYKNVQDMTGTLVATGRDLKDMTQNFQRDLKSISSLTGETMNQITSFLSWDDALSGRGYNSILMANEEYLSHTRKFRDNQGNINMAATIYNTQSVEGMILTRQEFYEGMHQHQRMMDLHRDKEIQYHIKLYNQYTIQARDVARLVSWKIFKNNAKGVGKSIEAISRGDAPAPEAEFDIQMTNQEIIDLQKDILALNTLARDHYNTAMVLYGQILWKERIRMEAALNQIKVELVRNATTEEDMRKAIKTISELNEEIADMDGVLIDIERSAPPNLWGN